MSIRVMVVDDDPIGLRVTKGLIGSHSSLEWIGEANNAKHGMEKIRAENPDAVFLDIHMPGSNGFDLLRDLKVYPRVIFVTASPVHAMEAFEVEAVDYLLKPVSKERFAMAVQRLERIFSDQPERVLPYEMTDRICLRTSERMHVIPLQRIVTIQAEGDFSHISLESEAPLMINRPLKYFDEILPCPPFLRADRSLIVNMERVQHTSRLTRNATRISLTGLAEPLVVGRTATERLFEFLEKK